MRTLKFLGWLFVSFGMLALSLFLIYCLFVDENQPLNVKGVFSLVLLANCACLFELIKHKWGSF